MNETIKFNDGLTNLHQEKMQELKKLLPNLFDKDGNFIKAEFENFVANYVDEKQEPFVFAWAGKQKAKGLAFKQSETKLALKFDESRSKNFDQSENLIIEGDNLHVLKLLLPSYKGKVKCIYIDPPYNTQNDFIYPDNFAQSEKEYLLNSGQIDLDGDIIINDRPETQGRKHSVWLSMMYPRLVLAREMLREDGVIFVSIDDNEAHHLRQLMDEVFGEECCTENIIWESKTKSQNTKSAYNKLQPRIEYILVYSQLPKEKIRFNLISTGSKEYPERDSNGQYRFKRLEEMNATGIRGRESMIFSINGVTPQNGKQWQIGKETVAEYEKRGDITIQNNQVFIKTRPDDERSEMAAPFWGFLSKDFGTAESAKGDLDKLMEVQNVFDTVKPVSIIKQLLFHATNPNDLILDFFAGSGTTAQAVMQLNQEEIDKKSKDGFLTDDEKLAGGRKFILVQLPEKIDAKKEAFKAGYRKISDITIERVKRASEKYKSVDNGFKVLSVTESAINRKFMNSIQASPEEIFAEIALSYGYGLNFKVENILDKVWKITGRNRSAIIILGDRQLSNETQKQIIALSDQLKNCQIFAQDACLNVEIIHNLYQHFEQRKVVIL